MTEAIGELETLIAEGHDNICELTAVKNGETVIDVYRHGYKRGDTLNVMSVTKSVIALLCGIAIDRGFIGSADDRALDYFPDYTPKRGEKTIYGVTLRHILTMTAPYKYQSEPWKKVCTSGDWTSAALDLLGGRRGLTGEFKYSTLGVQILSGVIKASSGMNPVDFANKYLFGPLNIAPHRNADACTKEAQFDFLMSKEPKGDVWFADPVGINTAGWGLALGANDMAKLGLLCLGRGVYGGERIVSAEWIDEMTAPHHKCGERFANMSYGFLWWIIDEKQGVYSAIGDGGNVIYVNPQSDTVVAVAATFKPRVFDRVSFIAKRIEPLLAR